MLRLDSIDLSLASLKIAFLLVAAALIFFPQPPFSCASSGSIIGRVSHPAEAGLVRKGTSSLGLLETRSRQAPSESRKTCTIPYSIEDWKFLYSRKSRKVSSALESSSPPIAATHNPVRMPFVETELS
jgi:hypothetical protein